MRPAEKSGTSRYLTGFYKRSTSNVARDEVQINVQHGNIEKSIERVRGSNIELQNTGCFALYNVESTCKFSIVQIMRIVKQIV